MTQQPVVLVTGSSGLIGRAVIERLADSYTMVGFDVIEPDEAAPVDFHEVDLTSDESVRDALDEVRDMYGRHIASVVHLAAYYDFSGEDSPKYDEITVQGTGLLLRALQQFEVEQFLFSSTMLIHAPVKPGQRIDEDSPIQAKWAYPQSKVKTEKLIRSQRGAIPAVFLRLAGVYTDYGQQPTLIQQIKRIYEKDFESFFFPGDTEAGQSLVHLEDAADAIVRTVEHRRDLSDVVPILIGEPDPPSYAELQDRIGELMWDREWPTLRVPETAAKIGAWIEDKISDGAFIKPFMIELADDHYALDTRRARALLGWKPTHRLVDALPQMIQRLKANPDDWYEQNGLEREEKVE